MDRPNIQFILNGFSEELGFRIFAFDGIAADRSRVPYTVRIDLALAHRYGIRLQELPLLCRALLDRRHEGEGHQSFTYAEDEMCRYAEGVLARQEAAKSRKPPRRPATAQQPGSAWQSSPR